MPADRPAEPTRRAFLSASAAAAAVAAAPAVLHPATARADSGLGAEMRSRAGAFLATLDGAQREAALFRFDARRRASWSFMWGGRPAPGVRLEQMTPSQKTAALELLASSLSDIGFETAQNIMLQQDILRDEWGKGSADRNRERFSVMIFGTPSASAPWSWRFEGHHLTLTFTLVGDAIVSVTPSCFCSEPNTVPSGPHRGLVVLDEEESLGRALFSDLAGAARDQARLRGASFGNILTTAGREGRVDRTPRGLPLADMSASQRDLALRLIEIQSAEYFAAPIAQAQRARVAEGGLEGARFGWAGDPAQGSIYYRLTGETFLIEFATLRNQPQHHHAVRHDWERNLGAHRV